MGSLTESGSVELKAASFIKRLKHATAESHYNLESQSLLCALMTPSVTHLQYYNYLSLMKQIEEVYERNIVARLANIFPAIEQIKASQLISEDLGNIKNITSQPAAIKEYKSPDEISIPFACGFMYVMEGSKLGGKVIYKHIHPTLGYSDNCGAKFIADYGNNTFGLWKEFLSAFSMYIMQNDCEEEAIQGAQYAFGSIYDFFQLNRLVYEY